MVSFKLKTMLPEDEFLALPWHLPLEDWPEETTVILPVGTHRNVVRFVPLAGEFLALKELPHRLAVREFDVLSTMRERSLRISTPCFAPNFAKSKMPWPTRVPPGRSRLPETALMASCSQNASAPLPQSNRFKPFYESSRLFRDNACS